MTALGIIFVVVVILAIGLGVGAIIGYSYGYDRGKKDEDAHWKEKGEWQVTKGERHE